MDTDFSTASPESILQALAERLEAIRLSQNISQVALAEESGVSRSTIARLARGENISLDSFLRVMQALGLSDSLASFLPDPSVRPVERVKFRGAQRRRASGKPKKSQPWAWGDPGDEK